MKVKQKAWTKLLACMMLCLSAIFALAGRAEAASINYVPLATDDIWVSASIDDSDEVDYYTVYLPSDGWLTIGYQAFDIRDSWFKLKSDDLTSSYLTRNIYYSSATNPITKSYEFALEAGRYSICINSTGSNTGEYRVKASFKPAENNESDDNDSFDTAMEIGIGSQTTGFLSIDDRIDFYRFNVPYRKTIRIVYTARIPDSYFQIWNSEYIKIHEKKVYTAAENNPKVYIYEETLDPGNYFIKILPYSDRTGRYSLQCDEKILASSIKITGKNKVVAGKSVQLSASVSPSNVTEAAMKWVSGDTGIAEVDQNGKVTTKRPGRVNITVETQDGSNVSQTFAMIVTPKKMAKPYGYNYSKNKLYVSWQGQYGASGYEIQYSKKKNFSKSATKTKKVSSQYTSKTFSKVKKGKYYVRVRAYVKVGKKYYNGDWSKVRTITVKR